MKVRIIQTDYTVNPEDLQQNFEKMIALMEECNEPLDIIVMPESCDVPAAQMGKKAYWSAIERYNAPVMEKAIEMAKRCNSNVFINCAYAGDFGLRNTTHVIDRKGNVVGRYYKAHPAPKEDKSESVGGTGMDSSYSKPGALPYTVELEGLKFGFMTCYDFYMYEAFARLARENVDIIIGCSHQRTDRHQALEIINRFLAYNTNAYLIRSSVSLGKDSEIGGCSTVVAPDGTVLVDMKSKSGYETVEIDPCEKYYKPAGYGSKILKPHYEYIEDGRRPWIYRNGGASVVRFDDIMPYPRICAHRGFNTVAPENSMPAFGAAVALGAEEIEFDLWSTKDGVLVSAHDCELERVSDGTGRISDYTYEELLKFDFGVKHDLKFKGLKIPTFEEILQKFAGRCIMNIHVKIWDVGNPDNKLDELVALIHKYDCEKHCYFMSSNDDMLKLCRSKYPKIGICVGYADRPLDIVDRAIEIGADKVQLFKGRCPDDLIKKAHDNGIIVNYFWADNPDEAMKLYDKGVDCVLTNNYLAVKNAFDKRAKNI